MGRDTSPVLTKYYLCLTDAAMSLQVPARPSSRRTGTPHRTAATYASYRVSYLESSKRPATSYDGLGCLPVILPCIYLESSRRGRVQAGSGQAFKILTAPWRGRHMFSKNCECLIHTAKPSATWSWRARASNSAFGRAHWCELHDRAHWCELHDVARASQDTDSRATEPPPRPVERNVRSGRLQPRRRAS